MQLKKHHGHKHYTKRPTVENVDGHGRKDKKSIARQKQRAEQEYSLEISRY